MSLVWDTDRFLFEFLSIILNRWFLILALPLLAAYVGGLFADSKKVYPLDVLDWEVKD